MHSAPSAAQPQGKYWKWALINSCSTGFPWHCQTPLKAIARFEENVFIVLPHMVTADPLIRELHRNFTTIVTTISKVTSRDLRSIFSSSCLLSVLCVWFLRSSVGSLTSPLLRSVKKHKRWQTVDLLCSSLLSRLRSEIICWNTMCWRTASHFFIYPSFCTFVTAEKKAP